MAIQGSENTVIRALAGNTFICVIKFVAFFVSGSGAMLSEAIHTLADVGNQALLWFGIVHARRAPDDIHPWGYGQAAFFWALVSALGIFFLGCGVTVYHGISTLVHPPPALHSGWLTWTVLTVSFCIDGWVLQGAVREVLSQRPEGEGFFSYLPKIKDPMLLAVLLEDFAACFGVVVAMVGIGIAQWTGDTRFDAAASIVIGLLLGVVAVFLVRLNQRFLIGQAIDPEIDAGIRKLLESRPSIEAVHAIQSRWIGPSTFAYKAEVDFDGTWFAEKLEATYLESLVQETETERMRALMGMYTEHVSRLIAKEVDALEAEIRVHFPRAAFIMLEPDG